MLFWCGLSRQPLTEYVGQHTMDPNNHNPEAIHSPDLRTIINSQNVQINQLASVVESQASRINQLSTEIETALTLAQHDRSELHRSVSALDQTGQGTVSSLTKITEQLDSLSRAITGNAQPPPLENLVPVNRNIFSSSVNPAQVPLPSASSVSPLEDPRFPKPAPFDGDLAKCRGFIAQCDILFNNLPSRYPNSETRVSLLVSLLSGRALDWAVAALRKTPSFSSDYSAFLTEFRLTFDHPPLGTDARNKLLTLCQGNRSVAEYSVEFRILAGECTWDDDALMCTFRRGLNDSIKEQILLSQPKSLAELISLSLFADDRLRAMRRDRPLRETPPTPKGSSESRTFRTSRSPTRSLSHSRLQPPRAKNDESEPMQIGRSQLSPEVRRQRIRDNLCLYCGSADHRINDCPVLPKDRTR